MKKNKQFLKAALALVLVIAGALLVLGCKNDTTDLADGDDTTILPGGDGNTDPTPVAGDFTVSGTGPVDYTGSAMTVSVTAKEGKSTGTVTVKYNGSATAPSAAGVYTVTFDVAAATGWKAAAGLPAGKLSISGDGLTDSNPKIIAKTGNLTNTWGTINTEIETATKYVILDLSGASFDGNAITVNSPQPATT